MSFWVHEQNGIWVVSQTGPGVIMPDGAPLSYDLWKQLRTNPQDAGKHFERDSQGKLRLKSQPNNA